MTEKAGRDTAYLNMFRGTAALWVLIAHCFIWSQALVDTMGWFEPKKAVDLFMLISGFLMFLTIDKGAGREDPNAWSTWKKFYARRFFRISPLYYAALLVVFLLWPLFGAGIDALQARVPAFWNVEASQAYLPANQDFSVSSVLLHVTYLFGLLPTYSFSTMLPDWSLSLEMQYYAVFPLIYVACRRYPMWIIAIPLSLASFVMTHVISWAVAHGYMPVWEEPSLLVFKLPVFLGGALIYEASIQNDRASRIKNLAAAVLVLTIGLINTRHTVFAFAILVAIFAYCATVGLPQGVSRLCRGRVVTFFSDTSYGAYLCHGFAIAFAGPPFLRFAETIFQSDVAIAASFAAVVIAITYPAAWLSFKFIEMPGIALGKRVIGSNRPIAAAMA